jgi:hypothetical protein
MHNWHLVLNFLRIYLDINFWNIDIDNLCGPNSFSKKKTTQWFF